MNNIITNYSDSHSLKIHYEWAESVSKWPLICFLGAACFCLGSSTVCHLCYVKNPDICDIVAKLDYWGIAILFLGSAYP